MSKQGSEKIVWTTQHQTAFDTLKKRLCAEPVLVTLDSMMLPGGGLGQYLETQGQMEVRTQWLAFLEATSQRDPLLSYRTRMSRSGRGYQTLLGRTFRLITDHGALLTIHNANGELT